MSTMPTHTLVRLCAHIYVAQLSLTHVRRQQYYQQSRVVPDFVKLYDVCNFCIYFFLSQILNFTKFPEFYQPGSRYRGIASKFSRVAYDPKVWFVDKI